MTQTNPTPRYILCPYCGHPQPVTDRCAECGGLFEPLSRKATQIAMGPWYIRDRNIPFRPGCSYEVLKKQVQSGRIKPNTVMRGPTTRQFWSVARNVPGVSNLLGYCHECNRSVDPTATVCPHCDTKFPDPSSRNKLGLLYPHQLDVDAAQDSLDREINKIFGPGKTNSSQTSKATDSPTPDDSTPAPVQGGIDLLDQVLGPAGSKKKPSGASGSHGSSSGSSATTGPTSSSAMPPTAPGKPAALDFTPTLELQEDDDAPQNRSEPHQDTAPTGPINQPDSGGSNLWLVWILVASNVVILALLALVVWYLKKSP